MLLAVRLFHEILDTNPLPCPPYLPVFQMYQPLSEIV
jgi:hypothetical protein